mgnify:CR=1 FL=1
MKTLPDGPDTTDPETQKPGLLARRSDRLERTNFGPIVDSEINVTKWANWIFQAMHSAVVQHNNQFFAPRVREWQDQNPVTGQIDLNRLTVHTLNGKEVLTTFDFRTWVSLEKLWWDRRPHKPGEWMDVSLRELARTMNLSWAGKKTSMELRRSIWRLAQITIEWRGGFVTSDGRRSHLLRAETSLTLVEAMFADRMTIDKGVPITADLLDDTATTGNRTAIRFRFNHIIENNLFKLKTKPVYLDAIRNISPGLAQSLYTFLDVVMADKEYWERNLIDLVRTDLGVMGKYTWHAEYFRMVKAWIAEIQGKPISTGIVDLKIARRKREQGYKLVVVKTPFATRKAPRRLETSENREIVDEILAVTQDEHSKGMYLKAARELSHDLIRSVLAETRAAEREGRIRTTARQYFTDRIQRYLGEKPLGPQLSLQIGDGAR